MLCTWQCLSVNIHNTVVVNDYHIEPQYSITGRVIHRLHVAFVGTAHAPPGHAGKPCCCIT